MPKQLSLALIFKLLSRFSSALSMLSQQFKAQNTSSCDNCFLVDIKLKDISASSIAPIECR